MLTVIKAFDYYHDGCHPTHYGEGPQDLPEDAAAVALAEGWAKEIKPVKVEEPPQVKKPGHPAGGKK